MVVGGEAGSRAKDTSGGKADRGTREPPREDWRQPTPTDRPPAPWQNDKKKGAITIVRYYGKYEEKTVPAKT